LTRAAVHLDGKTTSSPLIIDAIELGLANGFPAMAIGFNPVFEPIFTKWRRIP